MAIAGSGEPRASVSTLQAMGRSCLFSRRRRGGRAPLGGTGNAFLTLMPLRVSVAVRENLPSVQNWISPLVVIGSHGDTEAQRDGLLWVASLAHTNLTTLTALMVTLTRLPVSEWRTCIWWNAAISGAAAVPRSASQVND